MEATGLAMAGTNDLKVRGNLRETYSDVYTREAMDAMSALADVNRQRMELMRARIERRQRRARNHERISFLDPASMVPGTDVTVENARAGNFEGSEIPADLQRQWVQGTGPAAKPRAAIEGSIRNVAYALLSGADGWMFDAEDALGQVSTMSLDNQRNLKLAIDRDPIFLPVAERVGENMNDWAKAFFGRPIIDNWEKQLDFTTKIFRSRGLHLRRSACMLRRRDRILGFRCGHSSLRGQQPRASASGRLLDRPLSSEDSNCRRGRRLERFADPARATPRSTRRQHQGLRPGRAGRSLFSVDGDPCGSGHSLHRVQHRPMGLHQQRLRRDGVGPDFLNPNIDAIVMTYGYMRTYENRVRCAVATPDRNGRHALWQGGMEPNIPVGTEEGIEASMKKAVAGAEREEREGASGKWVAHWKMVHIVRPVWEKVGQKNQLGRQYPPLTYTSEDAEGLFMLEPAPRTIRGTRDLLSVGLQYGNAFGRGFQAAALKPADFFEDDDVLYLMEDMATGEIRLSILWEWLHKGARFTEDDDETGIHKGDTFTENWFRRLLDEEYKKLRGASTRNVHDDSKGTTLPIAREIVDSYVTSAVKTPWYVDLLNVNLDNHDLETAKGRIAMYAESLRTNGERITRNLDFEAST